MVTGPTGRGIPVLDLLALNERVVTMSAIFKFFKEKNPRTWQKIQTFVIDKHFVEWQVSETCSRLAKCCFVNPTCWCTRTRPWRPSLVLHQLIGTLPSSALPNAVQVPSICFILLMHAC
ncbi:hypothetical protein JG687_00011320 [Phytophthora cactorum]|uniref:ZSWIM1/3 RNaseH-like domain-containing protein n=1 Tax=Phytophthora cactorum TaxID=29920 RepID=A0A8T1U4Y6_9STRA|nr:hypothetical protein JG687_00011320 [Phytophthora cactorum]